MKTREQNVHEYMDRKGACALALSLLLLTGACGQKAANFSLLDDQNNFQQSSAKTLGKMDILFVVDNSGSMESSQQALTQNFGQFIQLFDAKGFDYRIAVTTTDAYKDLFGYPQAQSRFRDGTDQTSHTGIYVIDPSTSQIAQTFVTNAKQGIAGAGDERAFQSIERTLLNPANAGFPRADAFLSVIILSDEDDFSHDGSNSKGGQYSYSGLHPVSRYVSFLDELTGATDENRNIKYQVNSIAILDEACKHERDPNSDVGLKIGYRYMELSQATGGTVGSLCSDFGLTLSEISISIINAVTEFFLNREPNPDSIVVIVNGENVPRLSLDASPIANGYKYHADKNSISFHGSFVPGPGASIAVHFDPVSLK